MGRRRGRRKRRNIDEVEEECTCEEEEGEEDGAPEGSPWQLWQQPVPEHELGNAVFLRVGRASPQKEEVPPLLGRKKKLEAQNARNLEVLRTKRRRDLRFRQEHAGAIVAFGLSVGNGPAGLGFRRTLVVRARISATSRCAGPRAEARQGRFGTPHIDFVAEIRDGSTKFRRNRNMVCRNYERTPPRNSPKSSES